MATPASRLPSARPHTSRRVARALAARLVARGAPALLLALLTLLGACGGGGGGGKKGGQGGTPGPALEVLAPAADVEGDPGLVVEVRFLVSSPDTGAVSDVVAEVVFGGVDAVDVALAVDSPMGVEVVLPWDTTGVPDGLYRVAVSSTADGATTKVYATGFVQLGAPAVPPGLITEGGGGFLLPVSLDGAADGSLVMIAQLPPYNLTPVILGAGTAQEVELLSTDTVNDLVIVRYAPDGSLLWVRRSEGLPLPGSFLGGQQGAHVQPRAVACFDDGSSAVLAQLTGTAVFGAGEPNETEVIAAESGEGDATLVLLRLAADGALQWVVAVEPISPFFTMADLEALPDGRVAMTGSVEGGAGDTLVLGSGEPGEVTIDIATASNDFIAVYDTDGSLVWGQAFPRGDSSSYGRIDALASHANGDLSIAGWFFGTVQFGAEGPEEVAITAPGQEQRVFLARVDAAGDLLWVRTAEAPPQTFTQLGRLVAKPDGGTALSGERYDGPLTFDAGLPSSVTLPAGDPDASFFLASFADDGTLQWARDTGLVHPQSFDYLFSGGLVVLPDGGLLVADGLEGEGGGTTLTIGPDSENPIDVTVVEDARNVLVMRFAPDGEPLWAFTDGGDEVDDTEVQIMGLAARSSGQFTLLAHVQSGPATFGLGGPNPVDVPEVGEYSLPSPVALVTYGADGVLLPTPDTETGEDPESEGPALAATAGSGNGAQPGGATATGAVPVAGAWPASGIVPAKGSLLATDSASASGAAFGAGDAWLEGSAGAMHPHADFANLGGARPGDLHLSFAPAHDPAAWADLGHALAGATLPQLRGLGTLRPDSEFVLHLEHGQAGAAGVLFLGVEELQAPFRGGVLVPRPDLAWGVQLDAAGRLAVPAAWPALLPPDASLVLQAWLVDAAGPAGCSATNALRATAMQ